MKKVLINKIEISNFKGIANGSISFDSGINTISAKNGEGKTTIKNAFEWVLCQNVSDILPTLNNKEIPNLTTTVCVYLNINDCEYKLERISKGKYQIDNESKRQNKITNENTYKIDDIELKEKDYKEKLANILGNGVFENLVILTDKEYFNTDTIKFKWNDRRKVLFDICGVKNAINDIIEKEEFNNIRNYIKKGYATSDIKSMLSKEKKEYKASQNKNNILIEQKSLELQELEKINFEEIENQLKKSTSKLEKLQNSSKKENQIEQLNQLQDKLLEYSREMTNQHSKFTIEHSNQEKLVKELYNDCTSLQIDVKISQDNVSSLQVNLDVVSNIQDTCPTCNRKYDDEYINNLKQSQKEKLDELEKKIALAKSEYYDILQKYNKKVEEYNNQNKILQEMKFIPNKELENNIINTKTAIEQAKTTTLNNLSNEQISSLKNEISSLTRELAKKDFITKGQNSIAMWKMQNKELSDKIVDLERKEQELSNYVKRETEIILDTVNEKFKNGVSWALYKEIYKGGEGGIEEDCTCMYNKTRYNSLSNGEKNIANLETIKVLQNHFGVNLPIFSDNAESITIPYKLDNQVIELKVDKNSELKNMTKIRDIYC